MTKSFARKMKKRVFFLNFTQNHWNRRICFLHAIGMKNYRLFISLKHAKQAASGF